MVEDHYGYLNIIGLFEAPLRRLFTYTETIRGGLRRI